MFIVVAFVFLGVFTVIALLMFASSSRSSQTRQVRANLDSALSVYAPQDLEIVDLRKDQILSAIPWLNRLLLRVKLASRVKSLLQQADLKWTPGAFMLLTTTCFVIPAGLVYLRIGLVLFSSLLGAVGGLAPLAYVLGKRRQRFNKFEQRLPEALELIVSALRAGHSLVAALRIVAYESPEPLGGEFRLCYDEQNYGLELRSAMENLVTRVPLQDLRIVTTAILIQKESGGNLAEVLERTTHVIRERFRLKRQVRTHTAQGRLTGWILSFLPVVLGIALFLVNPKTMSVLWTNPIGIKMLYAAVIMILCGGLVIRKIVNMEV